MNSCETAPTLVRSNSFESDRIVVPLYFIVTETVHFLPETSGSVNVFSVRVCESIVVPSSAVADTVVVHPVGMVGIAAREYVSSDCMNSAAYSAGTAPVSEKMLCIVPLSITVSEFGVSISSNKLPQEINVARQEIKTAKKRENFNLRHAFVFIFLF